VSRELFYFIQYLAGATEIEVEPYTVSHCAGEFHASDKSFVRTKAQFNYFLFEVRSEPLRAGDDDRGFVGEYIHEAVKITYCCHGLQGEKSCELRDVSLPAGKGRLRVDFVKRVSAVCF
jgi:hypothetical protein